MLATETIGLAAPQAAQARTPAVQAGRPAEADCPLGWWEPGVTSCQHLPSIRHMHVLTMPTSLVTPAHQRRAGQGSSGADIQALVRLEPLMEECAALHSRQA